jgi:glycosyltransferase involved in cell wall biosynthesis
MMNLSYDGRWMGPTGIGAVAAALIKRKPEDIALQSLNYAGKISDPLSPLRLGAELRKLKSDVFWSPGFIPPFNSKTPDIITVHDLTHLHYYSAAHKIYYDVILRNIYKKCAKIITVSEYTKKELMEWGGYSSEMIDVVYNSVEPTFNADVDGVDMGWPYIFYAGNRRGYKNVDRLIEAYSISVLPSAGIKLLLTGKSEPVIEQHIARLNVTGMVEFSGFIPEEDLPRYYKGALAVTYISLYEGFGLPILEGMATGVPVITSNLSCMPEVAGNAALLVNPLDLDEIANAMNKIVADSDLRKDLISAGLVRAMDFTWDGSSNKFWNIVREVSENK